MASPGNQHCANIVSAHFRSIFVLRAFCNVFINGVSQTVSHPVRQYETSLAGTIIFSII